MLTDAIASRTPALLEHDALRRLVPALAVALAILVLALPMLRAEPAPLTSDESLYLAEGYNIATGAGPTYASGEIVKILDEVESKLAAFLAFQPRSNRDGVSSAGNQFERSPELMAKVRGMVNGGELGYWLFVAEKRT